MKYPSIFKNKILEDLYTKHRYCLIKNSNKSIYELKSANKLTLGFEKAMEIINFSSISRKDYFIMNIFSGAGGLLRLLSLFNPRFLVGIDLLYPGLLLSDITWSYAINESFNRWIMDLRQNGISNNIRWPLHLQMDATLYNPCFNKTADLIIMDPPFGWVAKEVLGIDEIASKELFFTSLKYAKKYLNSDGRIISLLPSKWINSVKNKDYSYFSIDGIGRKKKLSLIKYSSKI